MANLSGKDIFYWIESTLTANFAPLSNNLSTRISHKQEIWAYAQLFTSVLYAMEGKCIVKITVSILSGHLRNFHCQNLAPPLLLKYSSPAFEILLPCF